MMFHNKYQGILVMVMYVYVCLCLTAKVIQGLLLKASSERLERLGIEPGTHGHKVRIRDCFNP